jgi:hypothetical protein
LAAGCGGSASPASPSSATITSLTISGSNTLTAIGQKATLVAIGNKADFTTTVVTPLVTWQSSNAGVVSVAGGSATAVSAGGAVITASYQSLIATFAMSVVPQVDCSAYDPSHISILDEAAGSSLIYPFETSFSRMASFDTHADAVNGLALYQRFSSVCYVGRHNSRANRAAYIFPYWLYPTGRSTTVQPEDCEPYTPSTLGVTSAGASGWTLSAGTRQLMLLDTAEDANTMLSVARSYSNQCFIGRGNTRANPSNYILPYWK